VRVDITLTLFVGEDEDLLEWFEAIPQRQRARRVKGALRQGGVRLPREVADEAEEIIDDDAFAAMLGAL
jgi:hypothetical protein